MKRRLVVALVAALVCAAPVRAQAPKVPEPGPWKFDTILGLNLAQSAFSSNWRGGDKGAFVWVLNSDLLAERQFSSTFNLNNKLQLAYGQTANQVTDPNDPDERVWDHPEKSTDLVQFESTGRFTLQKFVDPYVAFRLDSQFEDESSPVGTLHFNPVTLKESAGIARVFDKTDSTEFISRLGFGFRQSFARTFPGSSPDSVITFSTNDGGFEWQTDVAQFILRKRVIYKGKLLVFAPVFYAQSGALEDFDRIAREADPDREEVADFWRVPDFDFQNTFTARITKIISVNLYLQMAYDKFDAATNVDTDQETNVLIAEVDGGIRKAAQWKQTLSLGLTYTLF